MTTNVQLERYIHQHKKALGNQTFLGVFASDQLPENVPPRSCLISNYSPHDKPGTHWIAMRDLGTKMPLYSDSYGLAPDAADPLLNLNTNFKEYLIKHSLTGEYDYNKVDLQSWKPGENECGEYATAFCLYGMPLLTSTFWRPLLTQKDRLIRDQMIKRLVRVR